MRSREEGFREEKYIASNLLLLRNLSSLIGLLQLFLIFARNVLLRGLIYLVLMISFVYPGSKCAA
jgi:hypothetical protein